MLPIPFQASLPALHKWSFIPETGQAGSLAAEPERAEPVEGGGCRTGDSCPCRKLGSELQNLNGSLIE